MEKHRNPDGTYNGVSALAELSGLSQEEIRWTWERGKELRAQGLSKDQISRALRMESKARFRQGQR